MKSLQLHHQNNVYEITSRQRTATLTAQRCPSDQRAAECSPVWKHCWTLKLNLCFSVRSIRLLHISVFFSPWYQEEFKSCRTGKDNRVTWAVLKMTFLQSGRMLTDHGGNKYDWPRKWTVTFLRLSMLARKAAQWPFAEYTCACPTPVWSEKRWCPV